jgi:low temperature requirement protein LtrA
VEMMVRSSTPTRSWTHSCSPASPQPNHYTTSNTQLSPHSMEQQWLPFILLFRAYWVFTGRYIIHWCNSKMETRVHAYIHTYTHVFISFSSLSYDRSIASSKASSPHSAIQSFLFQMRVSSPFLKVI